MQGGRLKAAVTSPAWSCPRRGQTPASLGWGRDVRPKAGGWRSDLHLETHGQPQALQTQQDDQSAGWGATEGLQASCLSCAPRHRPSPGVNCGPKSRRQH